jgi:hypothetical protein
VECEVTQIPTLLDALIAGFSLLGGVMAALSGYFAADLYWATGRIDWVGDQINHGIVIGFTSGLPLATAALMIVLL